MTLYVRRQRRDEVRISRDLPSDILVSVESLCIRASIQVENQYDGFSKVMQDSRVCFHLFRFDIHFIRQP